MNFIVKNDYYLIIKSQYKMACSDVYLLIG